MSRAVIYEAFGGPEVLQLREVPEPHAGPGEVRVRVAAAGLNPMDWADPVAAGGGGAVRPDPAVRLRVRLRRRGRRGGRRRRRFRRGRPGYGGALGRAVADFVVVKASAEGAEGLFHTPDGVSDVVASTLPVAGRTAAAALAAIGLRSGDTVLIGGAAGGVGVFAVQLAKAGRRQRDRDRFGGHLRVPATAGRRARRVRSRARGTGAGAGTRRRDRGDGPVRHGDGRGRAGARRPARADLHHRRGPEPSWRRARHRRHRRRTGRADRITDAILAGQIVVPIAAAFPIEQIRDAVRLQAGRHVHGKVVITL